MTALEVIAACRSCGVELIPLPPDKIKFRPASALPPDVREALAAHKREVLALLSPDARRSLVATPWPESIPALGLRAAEALTTCAACGDGTFVRYGDLALCCRCALELTDHGPVVTEYLGVLLALWGAVALADLQTAFRLDREQLQLAAVLGEHLASALARAWGTAWHRSTGKCPGCGEAGEQHVFRLEEPAR
jgi:hypothetical protein